MMYTVERRHCCVGGGRQTLFRLTYEVSYIDDLQLWRCFLVRAEEVGASVAERDVLNISGLAPALQMGGLAIAPGLAA